MRVSRPGARALGMIGRAVALTPAGRAIGERIMAYNERTFAAALAQWTASDLDALRRLLARLAMETVPELRQRSASS